jgi:hypothetical protein
MTMRKPHVPILDTHPELAVLALLCETLQLAELSLIATDRNIIDDEHPLKLPPESRIAQAILEQSAALQASLDAYERALDCRPDPDNKYNIPF